MCSVLSLLEALQVLHEPWKVRLLSAASRLEDTLGSLMFTVTELSKFSGLDCDLLFKPVAG